jgi:prepilin peptidase CpaA
MPVALFLRISSGVRRFSDNPGWSVMLAAVSMTLLPVLVIVAGTGDVLSRQIPNRLVLLIAICFFPLAWAHGLPPSAMLIHACAGLAVLLAGFALFSFGFMGGGDAKLLAAVAIWFGFAGLPQLLLMTVLAGGLLALAVLAWSVLSLQAELDEWRFTRRLTSARPSVPYGFAIAAGALLSIQGSWLVPAATTATWLTQI